MQSVHVITIQPPPVVLDPRITTHRCYPCVRCCCILLGLACTLGVLVGMAAGVIYALEQLS